MSEEVEPHGFTSHGGKVQMLRMRFAVAALFALLVAVGAPSTASAQTGEIRIQQAEMVLSAGINDQFNISGTGRCASAGLVIVQARATDLDTGASTVIPRQEASQCLAPGEQINWMVTLVGSSLNQFRAGDRLLVSATATGAITDSDAREVILKKYR